MTNILRLLPFIFLLVSCQSSSKKEGAVGSEYLTEIKQFTLEGKRAGEGYFSADGRYITFQSEREEGNPFYQIYVKDLQTGETQRVSPGYGKTTCSWIHPSNQKVLFSSTHLDSKAKAKQKAELEFRATGKQKRYAWDYDENFDIFATNLKGQNVQRLTRAKGYDAEGSYSPDGQWIAFASNRKGYEKGLSKEDQKRFAVDPSYMMDIYIMKADGSEVKQLTNTLGYDGGPFFSPDGKKITWRRFTPDGHSAEVFTMNIDGSEQKQLTQLKAMSWAPFFHPSGDYIIFTTNLHGYQNFELYIVDTDGSHSPVGVTNMDGFDGLPVFTPDGQNLAWSRSTGRSNEAQIFMAKWNDALARKALGLKARVDTVKPTVQLSQQSSAKEWVEYLASAEMAGRATASAQEQQYMTRIQQYFAELGLKPFQNSKSFAHTFQVSTGVQLGMKNQLMWQGEPLTIEKDWLPAALSKTGEFTPKPVVFVGYGLVVPGESGQVLIDDYADVDVKDKWVMMFRFVPEKVDGALRTQMLRYSRLEHKVMVAREKGAAGVIFVSGPNSGVKSELLTLKLDRASGTASLPVISVTDKVAELMLASAQIPLAVLQTQWDKRDPSAKGVVIPKAQLAAVVDLTFTQATAQSTVAEIKVSNARTTIIIGAHGDHLGQGHSDSSLAKDTKASLIHFGADDNASGVASVLQLARYFSQEEVRKQLKTNIAFAIWSGEELGNLGSSAFLKSLNSASKKKIGAYLNLDMVGRYKDKLFVQGLGSSKDWGKYIERANLDLPIAIQTQSDPYVPTDAMSFYLNDIPILSFFTGAHVDYHTPTDSADKINYSGMEGVQKFIRQLTVALASEKTNLKYEKIKGQSQMGSGRGFRIYLGTIPDYTQEGIKGVPISGVMKDGPAERAGLKGGDVIVGLAGFNIESIHDYVYSLESVKANQPTKISVIRGGHKLDLDITPTSRE